MKKMIIHLEGDSIDELRAQAVLALDLRIEPAAKVAEKVKELLKESEDNNTSPIDVPSAEPGVGSKFQAEVEEAVVKTEKAKKPNGKKPKATKPKKAAPADDGEIDDPDQFLRTAFNRYSAAFGVDNTFIDGPKLLERIYGDGITRIKDVPLDDMEKLHRMAAAIDGAILTNEFKREALQ